MTTTAVDYSIHQSPPYSERLKSEKVSQFKGTVSVPGDKSISHRSLIMGSLAVGDTKVTNLLEGDDVLATAAALKNLGAQIHKSSDNWIISGRGIGGLSEPRDVLNLENSGTGARLLMGTLAPYSFPSFFTGDASLRKRPMQRVTQPLEKIGVEAILRENNKMPLMIKGSENLIPIVGEFDTPSAQVKSALLLTTLDISGTSEMVFQSSLRDHTENMMKHFGVDIKVEAIDSKREKITIIGRPEIFSKDITVPGDPSSAAFLIVSALLIDDSDLQLKNVGMNERRIGLFESLEEMGANIRYYNEQNICGEKIADIHVKSSTLNGIQIPNSRAPRMIDEFPILSIAAACAHGKTVMQGLGELRVKESNRFDAILNGLKSCGVHIEAEQDDIIIHGTGHPPIGGGSIDAELDHRIAMSFLTLGCVAENPIQVTGCETIKTSFPNFQQIMNDLGGNIS